MNVHILFTLRQKHGRNLEQLEVRKEGRKFIFEKRKTGDREQEHYSRAGDLVIILNNLATRFRNSRDHKSLQGDLVDFNKFAYGLLSKIL